MEIERIENDPYGYAGVKHSYGDEGENGADLGVGTVEDGEGWDHRFSYLPAQLNRRHSQSQSQGQIQNQVLAPIGRPSVVPIQRPSSSHVYTTTTANTASVAGPGTSSLRPHRHSLEPPFVYQPPSQSQSQSQSQPQSQPQSHTASQASSIRSSQHGQSTPSSSSPSPSSMTTTLSSKAPPFEPSRGVAHTIRASFPPSTGDAGFASGVGVGGIVRTSPASRRSFTKWGSVDGQSK